MQQQLQVNSHIPLPQGTELLLALSTTDSKQAAPLSNLQVHEIILPTAQSSNTANKSAQATTPVPSQAFIEQVLKPFLTARIALLQEAPVTNKTPEAAPTYQRPSPQLSASNAPSAADSLSINQQRTVLQQLLQPQAIRNMPQPVQEILQQWQQQLPSLQQLQQPLTVQESVQKSGLSYEKQLVPLLQAMLTAKQEPNHIFKQLLKQHFGPIPATAAQAAQPAESDGTAAKNSISSIIQAVKSKLEQSAEILKPQPQQARPMPSLLNSLLISDHKAVLSRALTLWAQQLAQHTTAEPNNTQSSLVFKQLQSALAYIEHEQGQWLQQQAQGSNNQQWQLTIPLLFQHQQQPQEVRLVIDKEDSGDQQNSKLQKAIRWRLRLYFDLAELGPLDVDLELQLPRLKATFWSQQPNTLALLNHKLQPLRKQLTDLGAEVEELKVQHGQLPEPTRNHIQQRWVDIHG